MTPLTYISLFTGIGGFDLGFDRAGMKCVLQVEQDKHCLEVLKSHWPHVKRMEDVRDVDRTDGPVDLICGGFPCTDVSVAGRRAGLAGKQSGLWFEFHRVLGELRPRWAVIENVPGLLSSNGGEDFAVILRGLGELGYYATWRILDAQHWGVAQRRRRVFIVASLGDGRCAEVLFEREGLPWHPKKGREKRPELAGKPKDGVGSEGNGVTGFNWQAGMEKIEASSLCPPLRISTTMATHIGYHENKSSHVSESEKARCLRSEASHSYQMVANTVVEKWSKGSGGPAGASSETGNLVTTYSTPAIGNIKEDDISSALSHNSGGGGETQNAAFVAMPLQAGPTAHDESHETYPTQNGSVRRLTPTECARLQGFPDDWNDCQSDTQRYRQMGNAVCVPVAEWIGNRIMAVSLNG